MDKRCRDCGQIKPLSEFNKAIEGKDGLRRDCKSCQASAYKKYYDKHRENLIKRATQWVKDNKDCRNENRKRLYWKNPEKMREEARKYAASHREETCERSRQWVKNNPDKHRIQTNLYNLRHPDKQKAHQRVAYAVKAGKLPKVSALDCRACGGRASEYHHYLGYAKEHWLDVHPYCAKCHKQVDKSIHD
jgi:hypothetical protein